VIHHRSLGELALFKGDDYHGLLMKHLLLFFALLPVFLFSVLPNLWADSSWTFLPVKPLFVPITADPREPQTGVVGYTNQSRFEGEVGSFVEFLRYSTPESQWGWGIFGSGYILLDEDGATFPMRGGDWYAGMYISGKSGNFSGRVEFEHESAHLGDSLQGLQDPLFFSRENFNLTLSYTDPQVYRLYSRIGDWANMYPSGDPFFLSVGGEVYSPSFGSDQTDLRAYTSLDLTYKGETPDTWNKTWQLGLRAALEPQGGRAVRLALIYYDGHSDYGQFYQTYDTHWALGVFFDF
jgi:hypothetical protein